MQLSMQTKNHLNLKDSSGFSRWSCYPDSNWRPHPYQGCALPTELSQQMATRIGLEPTTPSVTGWCSNQLSYRAMIAQVHRFWRLTAGTCVIIPEKRAVVKQEFRKMSKKFWKVRHSGKNTKTKRTEYSLCACGRGSKSRTHGTRFWRPLLYQLSYTPKSCLLYTSPSPRDRSLSRMPSSA